MIINYYLTVFVSVECHGHHPMYTEGKVLNAANFCQHYTDMELGRRLVHMGYKKARRAKGSAFVIQEIPSD